MSGLRTVAEIGIGLLFGVGAMFNTVYTLSHTEEFYRSFADSAWLSPARSLINQVVLPNAALFTVMLILFQAAIAALILTRGDLVASALAAGAIFAVLAAFASGPGGTVGNLALAAIQILLAISR